MFSGGVGSWAAARRVKEQHPDDDLVLVFADTKTEDEDLYRFLSEAARNLDAELVELEDGRDVWQVFKDKRHIGNTRIANCSHLLKQVPTRKWLENTYVPAEVVVYVGIDWTETHRVAKIVESYKPYHAEAPLTEPPYLSKDDMLAALAKEGIKPPRLYSLGFAHNNCGGFCVKAGQGQFKLLLETFPERYAHHEQREQELRSYLDKDVAILRDRRGEETSPLTLKALRERVELQQPLDIEDIGGCGCFTDFGDSSSSVGDEQHQEDATNPAKRPQ
jgi:hypothetical protein